MWCMWYVYHIYIYIYIIYISQSCHGHGEGWVVVVFFTRGFGAVLSWPHLAWALQEPLSSVPLVVVSVTELNPWHGVGLSCIHFQIWNHFVKVNLERLGYTLKNIDSTMVECGKSKHKAPIGDGYVLPLAKRCQEYIGQVLDCGCGRYQDLTFGVVRHGYGSIPINTIFRGMNIHLPAILMFTRGTRFWHTATWKRDPTWKNSMNASRV